MEKILLQPTLVWSYSIKYLLTVTIFAMNWKPYYKIKILLSEPLKELPMMKYN